MMNLFNSHDTNRVLFLLNHDADQNDVAFYNNANYDWSDSIARYKGALIMQMTLPGAPTIYYGDEVGTVNPPGRDGSQWQDDPYNRAPFPWLDESGTPFYAHMQSQPAQDALSGYVSDLTSIRNSHAALRTGSFDVLDAGLKRVRDEMPGTPVLVVNEPIFRSAGQKSGVRYDFFYPRWAYDAYRRWLDSHAAHGGYAYLDAWDAVPSAEFTDSAVHLTPQGVAMLADKVGGALTEVLTP